MGTVIRTHAAAADIVADARSTRTRALAKAGKWAEYAEEQLGPTLGLVSNIEEKRRAASADAQPLVAALEAEDDKADDTVAAIGDEIYNLAGRPRNDPLLTILLPGGIAYYTAGDVEGQPARMELFAELLELGQHPQVSKEQSAAFAARIRASHATLSAAATKARAAREKVALYDRIHAALARGAAVQLANLKRRYKAAGFSESDIHAVIPNRPRGRKEGTEEPSPRVP